MDQSLTGKKKAAAKRRREKWRLSPDEWDTLEKLCSVLEVIFALIGATRIAAKNPLWHLQKFQLATLELSKTNVPTICMVLPLYKMIQQHLMTTINNPDLREDTLGLKSGRVSKRSTRILKQLLWVIIPFSVPVSHLYLPNHLYIDQLFVVFSFASFDSSHLFSKFDMGP